LHVLHVHDRLSWQGGADIHLLALLAQASGELRCSLAVGRIEAGPRLPRDVSLHRLRGLGGRVQEGVKAARRLVALAARLRPDLLHLHNIVQPEVLSAACALGPVVATVQDHRSFCPGRGKLLPTDLPCLRPLSARCASCFEDPEYAAWITALTRRRLQALGGCARLVTLSPYMADELQAAGLCASRLRVVPPFPWFAPAQDRSALATPRPPWILAAGRLVRAKGFHLLLQAYARSRCQLPLLIAGEGPARRELQAQARELGLAGDDERRAQFLGWVPHSALRALYNGARLAVLPSLWQEPFGITGLEALAAGVPVAAFDCGGISSWLAQERGWLLPHGDTEALAGALEAAMDESEAAARGARGAAWVAARYEPALLMQRLREVYREALRGPRAARME